VHSTLIRKNIYNNLNRPKSYVHSTLIGYSRVYLFYYVFSILGFKVCTKFDGPKSRVQCTLITVLIDNKIEK